MNLPTWKLGAEARLFVAELQICDAVIVVASFAIDLVFLGGLITRYRRPVLVTRPEPEIV